MCEIDVACCSIAFDEFCENLRGNACDEDEQGCTCGEEHLGSPAPPPPAFDCESCCADVCMNDYICCDAATFDHWCVKLMDNVCNSDEIAMCTCPDDDAIPDP